MSIQSDIVDHMKDAMRAKDTVRLTVLRGLKTAFTNELVAQKEAPDGELSDEKALEVIMREAKKRKDSIEQFRNASREELAADEEAELAILEEFLPEQMSKEDIVVAVQAKKSELGVADASGKGMLMGAVMKDLKGKADGNLVKEVVDEVLS